MANFAIDALLGIAGRTLWTTARARRDRATCWLRNHTEHPVQNDDQPAAREQHIAAHRLSTGDDSDDVDNC